MTKVRLPYKLIFLIIIGALTFLLLKFLKNHIPNGISSFVNFVVFLAFSFTFFRILGKYIEKTGITKAKQIGSQVKLMGYILSIFIAFSFFKELSGVILTFGTVTGIILGLTLQPVLGNFFAGVLIMATRFIEVGKKIRILSSSIPFMLTPLPPYKYFSVENADLGYKGEIIEVDWFFSVLKTDEGKIVKVPNLLLLNSAVIDYRDEKEFTYSLRLEFPLKMKRGWNLEKVKKEIEKILKGYNVIEGPYFNEQSDKDYVFIRLKIKAKDENWEEEKSSLLIKILSLKQKVGAK